MPLLSASRSPPLLFFLQSDVALSVPTKSMARFRPLESRRRGKMQISNCCGCPIDSSSEDQCRMENVVSDMGALLQTEKSNAAKAAGSLVSSISEEGRAALISALALSASDAAIVQLAKSDASVKEFLSDDKVRSYYESQAGLPEEKITWHQLFHIAIKSGIGMVGFGFTDNLIMILAGDVIQRSIGATFSLSTLMSAGLGNAVSDVFGTVLCGYIDSISEHIMPEAHVSAFQMQSKEAWMAETLGSAVGVTIGCMLGLMPLLFLESHGGSSPGHASFADLHKAIHSIHRPVSVAKKTSALAPRMLFFPFSFLKGGFRHLFGVLVLTTIGLHYATKKMRELRDEVETLE